MHTNRRKFLATAALGGMAAALPFSSQAADYPIIGEPDYTKLDEAMNRPVFKKELFKDPVIIETIELLRYKNTFLCRVRSKDGAVGMSVGNSLQMKYLYPVFVNRVQPYFIGKDARNLEALLNEVYVYDSNYKLQGIALWNPLATLEFAILDMMGRIANKSIGQLIGDIHHKQINVYQANSERDITPELTIEHLQKQLSESKAKAIKFKLGGRMSHPEYPANRSARLIPMVRKTFGDDMVISADANGSYDVKEAIAIGKIMEEYKYDFYEEPVPFDWYEETRQVAAALNIPVAGGEQEPSIHNFRWLIATNALKVVQQDQFYFGGMIRSMKVARMAQVTGKVCTPHTTGDGFGYVYLAHFISAIPNAGRFHEFKDLSKDLPFECKTSSLKSENGVVQIPQGPGLGVDIDPDYVKKHEVVKG
ncbi:mandelate racemase/muconate lactonizing enzyme family protein [Mucilaginibacter mali]|uniref:Mandelate racemase/muconate lactonizing enzyme family protein n=1 Tax=Mucilaginibacter mali TaxID=2740462 RepID=A0A7D4QHF4_9SPHI|nr:mandelate racemase/muconate lactonizing enzyme family protein [Mucilaginibacter mali]QKJ31912.1 mandelate racemase/muconate lactonizing enzyme family protein [Mucilaginibacter mali]